MDISSGDWVYIAAMWLIAAIGGLIAVFSTPDKREGDK